MEIVPNTFPSLFWGYSVIWVLLCLYVFSLARRMRNLEK
ncbi:MAG: CcmD family protein [Deltaproteobacteria bacterium]|nr:CcmD family protein [Deltaproteobacteria bacterium]